MFSHKEAQKLKSVESILCFFVATMVKSQHR